MDAKEFKRGDIERLRDEAQNCAGAGVKWMTITERPEAIAELAKIALTALSDAAQAPTLTVNADDLDFMPDAQHSICDMANVGKALLESIAAMWPGYAWSESPTEIVSDLINERDDARADYDRIRHGLAKWAAERWNAEVANRPLVNVHRRALDDTWRQVIRHCGADDVALLGPTHSDLVAAAGSAER